MVAVTALLIFCQALGAGIGAASAVWGELEYLKAMRDGRLDLAERAHLKRIAGGLRYGMTLLLLSSLGLSVSAYASGVPLQPALTSSYWILIALALIVITVARALSRQKISFPFASATLFTTWWFLVFLAFGLLPLTFGSALMSLIVATAIFYVVLFYARLLASRS